MDSLVSPDWLADALGAADLKVLDATLFLSGTGRDARAEHEQAHIPGAAFMDLDATIDPQSPLPHMMPDAQTFAAAMEALGVSDTDRIVVYDNSPLHSAARAWWMLKAFGVEPVAILDGGLQKWLAEGRPVDAGTVTPAPARFFAKLDAGRFANKDQVSALVHSDLHEIVDARSAARFAGKEGEPRPGLAAGHIPGSRNLPQGALFDADNSFKSPAALREAFGSAGVDLAKPMVTTCGSGITAAVVAFAAHLLGREDVRLYDGSWSEWGADPATPKAVGQS